MYRIKVIIFSLVLLLSCGGTCAGAILPDLANWGGPFLLSLIQDRVNGAVTVGEISGNPITGITYKDLKVTDPDGKTVFEADRLEIRLSWWSIPTLHLDLDTLALSKPRLYLSRAASGQWDVQRLVKPVKPAAGPPGILRRLTAYVLRRIDLPNLMVKDGEIVVTREAQVQYYTGLDFTANLTLRALGQPQAAVEVNRADLGVTTPQGRAELDACLTYRNGLARLDRLNLKLAGQTVVTLKGEVCRPLDDKTGLTCALTGQIGPLQGDQIHACWSRWPAPWDLSGAFSLSRTPTGGKLKLQGKIGEASYTLQGDLNTGPKPPVFQMDLDLKGLTTTQIEELKNLKAQPGPGLSPVNAHLHLKGTGLPWNPEALETHLELAPFRYRDLKIDQARLDLSGDARNQELQALVAGNFGSLDLSARGRLLPLGETGQELSGSLSVETKDFQPALAGLARLAGSSLTTRFTGNFRLPPGLAPAQAYLAGKLQASGRLQKEPLQDLTAAFVLDKSKLAVSQADLRMAGLAASFKGTLTAAGADVTFNAAVSGARLLPLPPGTAFASLRAEGAVLGPWKAPQVNLSAQVQKMSFQGVTLEAAHLKGSLAGLPPQSGSLQISGSGLHTPGGVFTRLQLSAGGAGGQWQFQVAATSPKEPRFEASGTADLSARPLVLNLARLLWQGQGLTLKNKTPFKLTLLPGWEISPATFQVDGGTITIAALARGQELSGLLEIRDLNAGLLAPLGLPASGKLNGRLTLAGNPGAPTIDGQIALSAGKIRDIPIHTLTTSLNYRPDQAQVAGFLEIGPLHSRLIWKGSVPVRISLLPPASKLAQDGLDLRVRSENINLSLLTSLSPEVKSAEGPVDLVVETRGNPYQPRVSGYVRWSAGSLVLHKAGTPYQLAPGEIRLQGEKIVIPGLVMQSDGTLVLSGEIALAGGPRTQARIQADNFRLLDRGGNELWTNGSIDLRGPLNALVAKGRLLVPKAQFRPTFFRTGMDRDVILVPQKPKTDATERTAPALYRNLSVDVSIDCTGNAYLIDPMGKLELAASLKARKDPGRNLVLGGEIRSLKGTADIQDRTFTVEHARLLLPGVAGKPIAVDAKAVHEMDDVTLVVSVAGTVTNPQIRMESLPPLPPADVLSYLVFGAPAATLSKDQYLALGAQSLGVLGGITPKKIDEILGSTIPFLSGIKLRTGTVGGRPTVGVGKEIVKNVSVFVGRNLNEERGTYEQQVGIEYKINKHLSVESQIGHRNSGADVLFNYDF